MKNQVRSTNKTHCKGLKTRLPIFRSQKLKNPELRSGKLTKKLGGNFKKLKWRRKNLESRLPHKLSLKLTNIALKSCKWNLYDPGIRDLECSGSNKFQAKKGHLSNGFLKKFHVFFKFHVHSRVFEGTISEYDIIKAKNFHLTKNHVPENFS